MQNPSNSVKPLVARTAPNRGNAEPSPPSHACEGVEGVETRRGAPKAVRTARRDGEGIVQRTNEDAAWYSWRRKTWCDENPPLNSLPVQVRSPAPGILPLSPRRVRRQTAIQGLDEACEWEWGYDDASFQQNLAVGQPLFTAAQNTRCNEGAFRREERTVGRPVYQRAISRFRPVTASHDAYEAELSEACDRHHATTELHLFLPTADEHGRFVVHQSLTFVNFRLTNSSRSSQHPCTP